MHIDQRQIAGQRINRHRGAQRAAANANMDEMLDLAQSALVNGFDQHSHPGVERSCFFCVSGAAHAALSGVRGGAPFGDIDDVPAKQFGAALRKSHHGGQFFKLRKDRIIEMGF